MVVTPSLSSQSGHAVQINPKSAVQPLPASDGAGVLQSVPNMSVIRKGGSSGDPLLRGLGGSRLGIQADGQFIYSGCGNRMDPPTAYIFPGSFDNVVVTKGPQTVTEGSGMVAGAVRFIRKTPKPAESVTAHANLAATVGSFGRFDLMGDVDVQGKYGYVRANAIHNQSDDYKDGNKTEVHSHFKRHSSSLQVGATPTENTVISLGYERSRGEAAYADRGMDGSKFDRDAWTIKALQRNITPWLSEVSLSYGRSKVDHIMDNYSLRKAPRMRMLVNPERIVDTAQLRALSQFGNFELQTGLDWMHDRHNSRMLNGSVQIKGKDVDRLSSIPFVGDQDFRQRGIFAELSWQPNSAQKVVGGLRYDRIRATYERDPLPAMRKNAAAFAANREQTYNLKAGFARLEQQIGIGKYHIGLGVAERAPDYWERNRAYALKPERNTQLDMGAMWQHGAWQTSASLFASNIKNFILVYNDKGMSNAKNISAVRYGGELESKWKFAPNWEIGGSLAYTHGKNRSDNLPLAQTPPLEAKTFLNWDNGKFSAGVL